uniref:CAZy families GT2 protein n=1 Tax=uncultured Arthrobacter sp. TaxID=114050 RepID=A0A060CL81_9MICC|nr:CAZy families GT2 protein [uncultured Arthrobacter sp.]
MRGNWTYFPSLAWRRDRLRDVGFRQDLRVAPDLVALATLVLAGDRMLVLDETVFEYRRHARSVSSMAASDAARFAEERMVHREIERLANGRGWHNAARAARVRLSSRLHAASLVPGTIRSRSWAAGRQEVIHAFGK